MKYSTRRKSTKKKNHFWVKSALIIMSAIAFFSMQTKANTPLKESVDSLKIQKENGFDARNVFSRLATTSLEILPESTRLDMLDYWDTDSVYKAVNVLGGLSWIEKMTDNYAKIKISPVSDLQIKILPDKKDVIVMTIYTVGDDPQAADSEIKFYDRNLNELPVDKYFAAPEVKKFFEIPKGSATKMKEIEQMIPFPTVAYNASPENNNIEARLTVENFINQDDWNIARLFVKPFIVIEWKNGKYK